MTLSMSDMPAGMNIGNTTIYIAGIAVGPPDMVSRRNGLQQIKFSARSVSTSGPISVKADVNDQTYVASSTTEYRIPSAENDEHPPRVDNVVPPTAAAGQQVALQGENLTKVTSVSLDIGSGLSLVCSPTVPTEDGREVSFRLPPKAAELSSANGYRIKIRLSTGSSLTTNLRLRIRKTGG